MNKKNNVLKNSARNENRIKNVGIEVKSWKGGRVWCRKSLILKLGNEKPLPKYMQFPVQVH